MIIGIGLDGFSGGGGAVNNIMKQILAKATKSRAFKRYLKHISKILLDETIFYFQINNGQFFGQFIGQFLSSLSAVNP